jgi:copper homeostasis protein
LKRPVEICIEADGKSGDLGHSVEAAVRGGADRIELCARMDLGGITPSPNSVRSAALLTGDSVELLVMIRPRGGDFFYAPTELDEMRATIEVAAEASADGVVFGVLSEPGTGPPKVDIDANANLIDVARKNGLKSTFHSAVDALPTPEESALLIAELGFDRLLISGIPWEQMPQDRPRLEKIESVFLNLAGNECTDLELVLAGGIGPANAHEIVALFGHHEQPFSLHAFSGVRSIDRTDMKAVSELVTAAC